MAMRRQVPRQPVDWAGSYRYASDNGGGSRPCRVIDISPAGAGLQLLGSTVEESMDRLIVVSIVLQGESRNAVMLDESSVRVGVEFPDLSGTAAEYVRSLRGCGVRSRW
jgi:hypothetical protein